MSVLVTGGAGYIGSHVVLALADAGRAPVIVDDLSTGSIDAVPTGVPLYRGDVADAAVIERAASEHRISAVMHFAGSIVVPESFAEPLRYYENNTVATRALVETCLRLGINAIVFSSTAAVYGEPEFIARRRRCADPSRESVRAIEIHGRRDHPGRRQSPRIAFRHFALFQRRGRRPTWSRRAAKGERDASD